MSEIKDGGQAFPRSACSPSGDWDSDPGMTLRDWFAGKIAGHLINETVARASMDTGKGVPEGIAELAYVIADAMIAEREKRK